MAYGASTASEATGYPDGWPAGAWLRPAAGTDCRPLDRLPGEGPDRYGRTVAPAERQAEDLGAILVREGLAWAFTLIQRRLYRSAGRSPHRQPRSAAGTTLLFDCSLAAWKYRSFFTSEAPPDGQATVTAPRSSAVFVPIIALPIAPECRSYVATSSLRAWAGFVVPSSRRDLRQQQSDSTSAWQARHHDQPPIKGEPSKAY